jgi:arylsulfatase A-like enzyme
LQDSDPTIAEFLRPLGYATAQIGKNHLGDRNEHLPTVHGFDEFHGILYHLNVPMLVKWPGVIKPGTIINEIMSAEDWMPTLVAAAGEPDLKEKALTGYKAGGKTFKNHLDGYNFKPFFEGTVAESPRREFVYFSDKRRPDGRAVQRVEDHLQDHRRQAVQRQGGFDQRPAGDQPARRSLGAIPGRVDLLR